MHWWPLNQHHRLLRSHALLCSGRQSPPRVYCSAPECKFPFHSPTPMAQTGPAGDHAGAGQAAGNPDTPPLRPSTPSSTRRAHPAIRLGDHGAGSRRLVLPGGREDTDGLVVARQTVDTGLDENEAELGVPVLAVALKVLADGDSLEERLAFQPFKCNTGAIRQHGCASVGVPYLLDEHVQVLRDIGRKACHTSLCQSNDQAEALRFHLVFPCPISCRLRFQLVAIGRSGRFRPELGDSVSKSTSFFFQS